MATYTISPEERRARAKAIIEQRAGLARQRQVYKVRSAYEEQERSRLAVEKAEREESENANFLVRGLSTIGDVVGNVLTGAVKGLEGIVDLGIGLVGAVGGIFSDDFQDTMRQAVSYDFAGEIVGNPLQEAMEYSYLENGGIVEQISSGIGQMLPAVIATIATYGAYGGFAAGASAAQVAAAQAAAQTASLVTLGVSAAGTSTEEAFNEGANYYAGLGYGVASGLVEVGTEKLFGGATKALTGAGVFDGITRSVAQTGWKRVALNAVEEGVEEMVSEAVNPLTKAIYKGKVENFLSGEHWKDIGTAGLVGSMTALAYSGSIGYGLSKVGIGYVGKEADISESLTEIGSLREKAINLQAEDMLDETNERKIAETTRKNYKNIEGVLKSVSETRRAKLIEKFSLSKAFNADGTMSEQLSAWFNGDTTEAQVSGNTENNDSTTLASPKKTSYSFSLRGNEEVIQSDLDRLSENRAKAYLEEHQALGENITIEQAREAVGKFSVLTSEMSEKAQAARRKFNKALNALNRISGLNTSFVITEANKNFYGSLIDDERMYISADTFENDTWAETVVHEYTHLEEGSEEYAKMVDFLKSDDILVEVEIDGEVKRIPLWQKAQAAVLGKDYGFDENKIKVISEKVNAQMGLTPEEVKLYREFITEVAAHETQYLLGTEAFIDKIVASDRSLARKLVDKILNLKEAFSKVGDKATRGQLKMLRQAEKLYLDAARKAGDMRLVKYILSRSPETEEEVDSEYEYEQTMKFSLVEDKKTLDFLNEQKHIKVYRAMQVIDGKLYPPMAAKIKGGDGKTSFVEATQLGKWYQADEHPELVANGKFTLNKGNGSSITAAYNPYWHTSKSPLNDQFTSAYKRDNLVTVECEVPESELTSGYKAEGAKDSVGEMSWHSGQVSSKLSGEKTRKVILSRWVKVNRIVPDSEVASKIAKLLEGENVSIPDNTITPSLRRELEKLGVEIMRSGKVEDIRYSLKEDSNGKKLSEGQIEFFKDSKVRDEKGRLLTVYHGTNNDFYTFDSSRVGKGIDQFGSGYYFTTNKDHAGAYGNRTIEAYLNLKNPFIVEVGDNGGTIDQFYRQPVTQSQAEKILKLHPDIYSAEDSPLGNFSERYWTEGATESVIKEVAAQMHEIGMFIDNAMFGYYPNELNAAIKKVLGYDGIQVNFGKYEKYYVAWEQNQIKLTTNKNPSKNADIRYALKIDGETTPVDIEKGKNLVALHNLSEDKLLRVVELGGFPMPSIAVTTTELPHENYGDITVVFGRETIDPENDYRNVVYDRDAWTPTTPTVDVKLSNEAVDALVKELQNKVKGYSAYERNIFSFFDSKYRDNNGDYILSDMDYTRESFGERAIRNSGIVAAYLSEKGVNVEPVYAERGFTMGWSSFTRKEATELFDFVGITKDITRYNATQEQRDAILEKFIEYKAKEKLGLMRRFKKDKTLTVEQVKEILRGEYDDGNVSQLFFMAEDFFNEKRPKDIYDEYATLEKMQSEITDKQDFYDWFWNKVEPTFEKKGIDNDSDVFDRRGNRRSFEQRHYSYTAANIVRAMQHGDQEGNIPLGMTAGALAAKLSKRFDSIEDIREAKEYLALVSEEDLKAFNDKTYELYDELVTTIAGRTSDFMSDSSRRDDVGYILGKCAAVKPLTIENIKRKFRSETRGYNLDYKFNDQIAEQALLLFESLKHIPTTYFEAKPRRVVDFSEIKTVLIPETASDKLKTQLSKKKIKWQVYGEGENARSEIIKTMDDVRFSLKDSQGRTLSEEQKRYFKDSKARDEFGNLLVVYHGTKDGNFYTFEYDKNRQTGTDYGKAFYFTTNLKNAKGYAKDNHKDPRIKEYEAKRESLKKQILAETDSVKRDELIQQFHNVKIDGKSILQLLYDVDYDTGGEVRQVYLNLVNPLIADGQKKYHYEVYPELFKQASENGNDGIIVKNVDDSSVYGVGLSDVYIAFSPEQIKLTSNLNPTKNEDIRFLLSDDPTAKPYFYELTDGQVKKLLANSTKMKVYSKVESEGIINDILGNYMSFGDVYGVLSGKSKAEVIDMLWRGLNTAEPGRRAKVALDVAEYIIQHSVVESMYDDASTEVDMDTIALLKPYLHKINLDGIKGEIKHRYDRDNSPYLLWGKRKGDSGLGADVIAMELDDLGFHIDAINEADIFFQIDEAHRSAVAGLKKEAKSMLDSALNADERRQLKQEIARQVLIAFDEKGKPSKLSAFLEEYATKAKVWREKYYEERNKNKLLNRVLDKIQKLKDIKLGTFLNASQFKNDVFKGSIERLANIKYRGNLNESGTRGILDGLAEWYVKENPMLQGVFDEDIASALLTLARGEGKLTVDELKVLENVIDYFKHFVETYNKVWRGGQYVEAQPIAEKYVSIVRRNKPAKVGWLRKFFEKYETSFADPMTLVRYMDRYDDGFYTEILQELRKGAVGASVMEMEMREPLEAFYKKHKKFLKEMSTKTIEYQGTQIPLAQAMLLYMSLNRDQAILGLAKSGFTFNDGKETIRLAGFALEEDLEIEEIRVRAKEVQSALASQFTEVEKEYISIAEKLFNETCKEAKKKTDILRRGYTNALEDYYVPIRRANIAHNVDTSTFFDEMSRVSNASFNRDTVKGAKNELFIESLDAVLDRHIRAVAQYANLALAIDQYNLLYNLDIGDNPNKPTSVKTESVDMWSEGDAYFKKLISDIQGIPASKGDGVRFMGWLRGSYAKYQLGANPKVWITQLSSFAAAGNILDIDCIIKGIGVKASDVDEYCGLAKVRNTENAAALAQGVVEKTGKVGDVLMKPIGMVDRFVIARLFGACQLQIEKNEGLKVGTKENKVKAGELLEKVILETQQNALATEKSSAMRSGSELMKTLTMFSADSMKVIGRVVDAIGEVSVLKAKRKLATDPDEIASLDKKIKAANKKARRAVGSLVSSAVFMALVAQLFRWLYNKDDEDDNVAVNMTVDAIGNLLGGLPFIKDIYSYFAEGYDFDNYAYSAINDMFDSAEMLFTTAGNIFEGNMDSREVALTIKNLLYAGGQMFGIPTRNVYNIIYGLTKRISPSTAYSIDDMFYKQNYRSDLAKAIENEDEAMVATITSLMLDENIGSITDSEARKELDSLVQKGFDVIPRSVSKKITYDGVEYELTPNQVKQFEKVYSVANEALASLVKMSQYKGATDEVKAKAVNFIYNVYYNLALQDFLGVDLETKSVLFAEAIDIEKLAIIVATANSLKADLDKKGVAISGTRKAKIQSYVNSLQLKAVEKYMIMGYLGYKNTKGEIQVKAYINRLSLTKTEKAKLLEYSGYAS